MSLHVDHLRPDRTELQAAADRTLAERLDEATLRLAPSFSAAVFDADGVLSWAGRGHQRRDSATPTRKTIYRIASMSKSFLGAAALLLRDEGRLDMHAPVTDYVPEFASAAYDGRPVRVTLDMLMANRAGLAEDNPWGDNHLGASRDEMRDMLAAGVRLALPPDTTYQYSNLGISLVGRAIEHVTGRPVERFITERLLRPLGLDHTAYDPEQIPDASGETIDVATGWRSFDDGATWASEPFVGCGALGCIGALFSTVDDIAAWAGFLRSAFTEHPSHEDVLSSASRREMQRVHTIIPGIDERLSNRPLNGAGYGYGLIVEHHRRLGLTVQHSGGLPGFTSHMRWHVDSGVGAVVFGNSDAVSAAGIAIDVLDRLLDEIVLRPEPTRRGAPGSLLAVDDSASGVLAAQLRPWPETVAAARRLDEIVRLQGASAALDAAESLDIPEPLDVPEPPSVPEPLSVPGDISDAQNVADRLDARVLDASALFAPNVLSDVPADVRDRRIAEAAASLGGVLPEASAFDDRVLTAATAACLRWRVPCREGALICDLRMVGLSTPLVQAFSVAASASDGQISPGSSLTDTDAGHRTESDTEVCHQADAGCGSERKPAGEPIAVTDRYRAVL